MLQRQQHEALKKHLQERVQQCDLALRKARRNLILFWVGVTIFFCLLGVFWSKFAFVVFFVLVIYALAYGHGYDQGMEHGQQIEREAEARRSEWE